MLITYEVCMSKFVSISDTLKSFLESFTASFIVRTHVETTPRGRATHPLLVVLVVAAFTTLVFCVVFTHTQK